MWKRITLEWLIIILCLCLLSNYLNPFTFWLAALVIGSRQHALGILGHWAMHRLMPKYKTAQWLCLGSVGIDPKKLLKSHWAHHNTVSDPVLDPEVAVVKKFPKRWLSYRHRDLLLDITGIHIDEALFVMSSMMVSIYSILSYLLVIFTISVIWGPLVALVWPLATITGLLACHRLRARTEHHHLLNPGVTLKTEKPSLIARMLYLPHYTWMHKEHHELPNKVLWK